MLHIFGVQDQLCQKKKKPLAIYLYKLIDESKYFDYSSCLTKDNSRRFRIICPPFLLLH